MFVLTSLLAAMTLASGLLLALEPNVEVPNGSRLSLSSIDGMSRSAEDQLFDTGQIDPANEWSGILITHHLTHRSSGGIDLASMDRDRDQPRYHFRIEDPVRGEDGRIRISTFWQDQTVCDPGDDSQDPVIRIHIVPGPGEKGPSDRQIRSLLWLVHRLQVRFALGADRVTLGDDPGADTVQLRNTDREKWLFPVAQFRQQLLISAGSSAHR